MSVIRETEIFREIVNLKQPPPTLTGELINRKEKGDILAERMIVGVQNGLGRVTFQLLQRPLQLFRQSVGNRSSMRIVLKLRQGMSLDREFRKIVKIPG